MRIRVSDRQSLADIAIRETGSLTGIWELAREWGHGVSEEPGEGTEIETMRTEWDEDADAVIHRYRTEGINPATGLSGEERLKLDLGGIEYMSVEGDFRVS